MRWLLVSAILLAVGVQGAIATGKVAARNPEVVLRAADGGATGIEQIAAGYENLRDATRRTEPVTDILLRLRHSVRQHRATAFAAPSEAERSFVEVQLFLVVGGRINSEGQATCDRFDGDVMLCQLDCEGGTFGLRRGKRPGEHFLVLGVASMDPTDAKPALRVGACATTSEPPMLLMPRTGRLAAEVPLVEAR